MAYRAASSRVLECYADLGIADILGVIHEEVRRNNNLQRDLKLHDLRGDRL